MRVDWGLGVAVLVVLGGVALSVYLLWLTINL